MVEEIIWSPLAVQTYDNIIEYLLNNFGEVAVKRFVQHIDDKLKLIASRPAMFRVTGKRSNTYITSIRKKTTLTYRYDPAKKQVELVVFWGMQDLIKRPD
ncbi:MAG: type II toxin-antitoxin system RelE/ParE family toxin [Segetibacter sp.]